MRLINRLNNNYAVSPQPDYALEFNGTDEYLQIALPNNELLASAGTADFYSSGSAIAGWIETGAIDWAETIEGMTYSNTINIDTESGISKTIANLVIGQKYKLKVRYRCDSSSFCIGSGIGLNDYFLLPNSFGEFNTVSKIFVAVSTTIFIGSLDNTASFDYASIKRDQGFDLNKDQEMILHSKNWDFEGSTTDWAGTGNHTCNVSTLDKSSGTQSLLISASGAGSSGSNYVSLSSANLESCVSGKKYTLQGEGRLDPASLTYGANLLTDDGTSGWTAGKDGTGSVVAGEYVLVSSGSGYIYRVLNSPNNIVKISFKAKADTYTGKIDIYHQSNTGIYTASTTNLTSTYQTFTLYIASRATQQTFYIQLTSTHTGNVYFDDITIQEATPVSVNAQLGTKSVTSSALSIVAGTFTKFVLNFEATSGEVSQDLKLWLSGAGNVFVDKLSLTQAYDCALLLSKKGVSANTDWLLALGYGSDSNIGYDIYQNSSGNINFGLRTSTTQASAGTITGTANQIWVDLIGVFNRTNATSSYIKSNKLGQSAIFDITDEGKAIVGRLLVIGSYLTGNADAFAGQLSYIQVIRFENISQSSFNSAITGLQYPTGGGAEEVLRLTFQDGSSIVNCLKDYSPKGHTVSGTNVDITNRKRVIR